MDSIANFLFEVGMLQKTPRSGFQFLGSGGESVAEHILRTLFIAYTLCKLEPKVDEWRVLKLCLFHDLPEARTGDMNYVNKKYVDVNEEGTEAAAVTTVVMTMSAAPMEPVKPFEMIVDRPFLFLIADRQTETILFLGVLFDPQTM